MKPSLPFVVALWALPTAAAFCPPSTFIRPPVTVLQSQKSAEGNDGDLDFPSFPKRGGFFIPGNSTEGSPKASSSQLATMVPETTAVAETTTPPMAVSSFRDGGITEAEVTSEDGETVRLATKRLQRLHPRSYPDLLGLVFWIQNGKVEESTLAMKELSKVLQTEWDGDETTLALYRSCGHVDIVRTMMRQAENEDVQQHALQVIANLCSPGRANKIQFSGFADLKYSLDAAGTLDCAVAAMEAYPDNVSLVTSCLTILNSLMDIYTFEDVFATGLLRETIGAGERFPLETPVVWLVCDILYRVSHKPAANLAKLESIEAVSLVEDIVEDFSLGVKDRQMHAKAQQALHCMLKTAQS